MRVLVVSDTHLSGVRAAGISDVLAEQLAAADVILHAGDITDAAVLDELARHAPVHAVRGNNDVTLDLRTLLPERTVVNLDGCAVAMVHDSGQATGRGPRLRRWFPDADAVVFGHSHIPWHERDVRAADGHVQHHVNPGSATQARRQPACSVAWLDLDAGVVRAVRHQVLPRSPRTSDRAASVVTGSARSRQV